MAFGDSNNEDDGMPVAVEVVVATVGLEVVEAVVLVLVLVLNVVALVPPVTAA
jgi:hypothetical protein